MTCKVIVVGSYNTDLTMKTGRIPSPGETIIGARFSSGGGGKGANQAVAAARAGASVAFVGRVGGDTYGRDALERLRHEGIDTRHVSVDPEISTGIAFIIVDDAGENSIVVASGANGRLSSAEIALAANDLAAARVLLLQLETPMESVASAIATARRGGATVILNPAPAAPLAERLLREIQIITPNRVEAEVLTGIHIDDGESLRAIGSRFLAMGMRAALITLGADGVFMATKDAMEIVPAYPMKPVDSTGAGDVFNGALAAHLAEGLPLETAVRRSVAAASLSVTRLGAIDAAPSRAEIDALVSAKASTLTPKGISV